MGDGEGDRMAQRHDEDIADGTATAAVTSGPNREQAQSWDGVGGEHWVEQQERREAMFAALTPHLLDAARITAGCRVLDIGCGCGGTTRAAARRAGDGEALGVDLSRAMLAEAGRLAAAEGLERVRFAWADAQTHPFPAGAFDVALSRFGVMFFADPVAAFTNIGRGLRSGGRLAFLCWRDVSENAFVSLPRAVLSRFGELPDPARPGEPGPFSLADPERVTAMLTAAGFTEIAVRSVDEPMRMGSDVADAVDYQMGIPVARAMAAGLDEQARAAGTAALREALEPYQGPDGVILPGAAWLVTARRP